MTIGSFVLIKNEAPWLRAHLENWLPHLDQLVFFDGNSTDGTLEIFERFQNQHPQGYKITLVKDRDPKNLQDDYVRLFNEAMWTLRTDWAFFLHPDMIAENPERLREWVKGTKAICGSTHMRSFAGEPGGQILEIVTGRHDRWKNLYRLRNPDFGAHYHGWYGAENEDVYFREITGDEHQTYGKAFDLYPYPIEDSGLRLLHFSDVRPYERRLQRMIVCLENQNYSPERARKVAPIHPRVSLKTGFEFKNQGDGFVFKPYDGPCPMAVPA